MKVQQTILIKIGGQALEGAEGYLSLGQAIRSLAGIAVLVVHGGGAEISKALGQADRHPLFIDGLRVTTDEDMELVEKVLSEEVNGRIAGYLQQAGVAVCRLSGKTRSLLIVEKLLRDGRDLGCVGQVRSVNPQVLMEVLQKKQVPLISPVSADAAGHTYNVNADSAAAALAAAMACTDLIYFTDVPGVQVEGKTVSSLPLAEARRLIQQHIIHGGMVAKMESAFDALAAGVQRVHISAWHGDETLQKIISGQYPFGTAVVR